MCRIKVSVSLELVFSSMLVASIAFTPPLHAQTAVDTTLAVRMIDAVNSTNDPAGKRYRASVTGTVDAANGVVIAQGSAAVVTLANSGTGWSAQLSSVSINGQPVAVASGPATVTGAAQGALVNATNAMNSVLGGFGHHVKVPAAVSAVATGQRVILPPGTTLTFVLSQPPVATGAPSMTASAAPAPGPASSPATPANPAPTAAPSPAAAGRNDRYVFCSTGHYANPATSYSTNATEPVTYFSEFFPEPNIGLHVTVDWNEFLQKKSLPQGVCNDAVGLSVAQAMKKQKEEEFKKEGKQIVETGWKFDPNGDSIPGQAAAPAPAQAGAPPAGAFDHYSFCSSDPSFSIVYFSDVFPAQGGGTSGGGNTFDVNELPFTDFLQQKYAFKKGPFSQPERCSKFDPTAAGLEAAQSQKQRVEDIVKQHKSKIVETGWKNTLVPRPAAPPAAANESYLYCYSDQGKPVVYFSEIFAAAALTSCAGRQCLNAKFQDSFLAFLQKTYDSKVSSDVACEVDKPTAAGFDSAQNTKMNREGLAKVNQKQIIETGWKYAP